MMVATRKRNRPHRKARLPQLEQLEDRRVFNASWQTQLPPVPIQFTEVVIVERWVPAPAAAPSQDVQGLGLYVSAWAHEGVHGVDLAALIHRLQGKGGDDGQGGQQGDGGDTGGGSTGSTGGSTSGGPVSTGGTSRGAGGDDGGSHLGTGGTPAQGTNSTPSQDNGPSAMPSAGDTAQPVAAVPALSPVVQGVSVKARDLTPISITTPATSVQVASAAPAALAAVEAVAGEPIAARALAVHHELVAHADLHPAVTTVVLNAPSSYSSGPVRIDYLPGGTEQPAFAPRGRSGGSPVDQVQPAEPNAVPPAEAVPAVKALARPDGAGVEEKADPAAEPQEAGLLTKVPLADVAALGLQQALRRLKDLLADLTTGRALLHALPLTGAALALGGAAFGLVRWRKKRRTAKGLPEAAPDEEERETWLPGSGSLPPVDPA